MLRTLWILRVPNEAAYHRAGGRRKYNARRKEAAKARRTNVYALHRQGLSQTEIAERLGVHKSTICRDMKLYAPNFAVRFHRALDAGEPWAIMYLLKTKGRARGY